MSCPQCAGFGYYFDPQCQDNRCAHGPVTTVETETVSVEGSDEQEVKRRVEKGRVMECPPRSCTKCPNGKWHRDRMRELQEIRAEQLLQKVRS